MAVTVKVFRDGEIVAEAAGTQGETVLKTLSDAGVFLDAPCGGRGRCGKCTVRLSRGGEWVKACQTIVESDMEVHLPDEMKMKIAGQDASEVVAPVGALGVAVDIGTTTVVAHLTEFSTAKRVATASGVNAQRPYGADVISRIEYSAANGHETLSKLIQTQIDGLILDACKKCGADPRQIEYLAIAGNTIMEHLAAGYSPAGMGTVPFEPVSLFGGELPGWDTLPCGDNARIYFTPAIAPYVGGDITAGMLYCELENDDGPTVFIDIGTNGEIAMKLRGRYYCCATAAGPAFEGAEITYGMAAITGAISHVRYDGGVRLTVIDDAAPQGLCGSGLLDTLAMLLDTGAVDESGRLLDRDEISHPIATNVGKVDGKNVFWLSQTEGVYMSAGDVRKLQLAKAAIGAGIQTLLKTAEVTESDVKSFILAGGFGSYMDKNSAARIGLFPSAFLPVTRAMGNTAGEGAALALVSSAARDTLDAMRGKCEYVELSTSPIFNEEFVENMTFEDS
jgi:uncharacterized 2Fe-2S/4Fe-4S cluster protein (DUF4445 family)